MSVSKIGRLLFSNEEKLADDKEGPREKKLLKSFPADEEDANRPSHDALKKYYVFRKRIFWMLLCSLAMLVMSLGMIVGLCLFCKHPKHWPLFAPDDSQISDYNLMKDRFIGSIRGSADIEDAVESLHTGSNAHKTLVGMISINRKDVTKSTYIYQTLSSLLPALRFNFTTSTCTSYITNPATIHIFVGSTDRSHLKFLIYNENINIVEMNEDEWALIEGQHVQRRASYNYYRMVKYLVQLANDEQSVIKKGSSSSNLLRRNEKSYGLLLFEDDIVVSNDASVRLDSVVEDIEGVLGRTSDFILSSYLSECHVDSIMEFPRDRLFTRYQFDSPQGWCCTQGIYVPLRTAKKLLPWLESYISGETQSFVPYDHQMASFSLAFNVPILAMRSPFTQHIGKDSSGLGAFHKGITDVQIDGI